MPLFQVTDLRISSVTVVADNAPHATHLFLEALRTAVGLFPRVTYQIAELDPKDGGHARALEAAGADAVGFMHFEDGGWKLHPPGPGVEYD